MSVETLRERSYFPEAVVSLLCPSGHLFNDADTSRLDINQIAEQVKKDPILFLVFFLMFLVD